MSSRSGDSTERIPVQQIRGRLPDFLIVGAAKSGTSSLFSYLARHPAIFGSDPKEPCYFDPHANLDRGLLWYRQLFADAERWQLCGEASTNYTRYPQVPGVPARIQATVPDAKLIYLMRHPVDRAYSHYVHAYTKEEYPRDRFELNFEEFAAAYPRVLDSSDYALQLKQYFERFPREQMLLLFMGDLERDPLQVCREVFTFLGVDPEFDPFGEDGAQRENVGATFREGRVRGDMMAPLKEIAALRALGEWVGPKGRETVYSLLRQSPYGRLKGRAYEPPPMTPRVRELMLSRFMPAVDYVEELTGRDLSAWRE